MSNPTKASSEATLRHTGPKSAKDPDVSDGSRRQRYNNKVEVQAAQIEERNEINRFNNLFSFKDTLGRLIILLDISPRTLIQT